MTRKLTALTALITAFVIGIAGLAIGATAPADTTSDHVAAVGDGPDTTPEPVPWRP